MVAHILRRLDEDAERIRDQWQATAPGTPTRHCVLDGLLPDDVALEIYRAFPRDGEGFIARKTFRERKRTSYDFDRHPGILADVTFAIQDPRVAARVGQLTGMDGLEPDPHLYAGGLSMMFRDEFLNPHIDNSHEKTRTKYRRVNLLYYVAPGWTLQNGGNLELWNPDVTNPVTIHSAFNRLVIMETNKASWHSVSPVQTDEPRCCVSNYFFSEGSPTGEHYYHVTSFTGRPGQRIRRVLGKIDNAARKFARERLGLTRETDAGYEGDRAHVD
jgi:hypothetical protein